MFETSYIYIVCSEIYLWFLVDIIIYFRDISVIFWILYVIKYMLETYHIYIVCLEIYLWYIIGIIIYFRDI